MRSLFAAQRRTAVATGEAQRNPWKAIDRVSRRAAADEAASPTEASHSSNWSVGLNREHRIVLNRSVRRGSMLFDPRRFVRRCAAG